MGHFAVHPEIKTTVYVNYTSIFFNSTNINNNNKYRFPHPPLNPIKRASRQEPGNLYMKDLDDPYGLLK